MGKPIISQRRGRSRRFEVPSFNWAGRATVPKVSQETGAKIVDIIHSPGHSAPLARVEYGDHNYGLIIASEGVKVGDTILFNCSDKFNPGSVLELGKIPEGTLIHNVETMPGDGGRLARGSGTFARILMKSAEGVTVELPSGKKKILKSDCRASIGTVAGGGRKEKPLLKAGKNYFAKRRAKNRAWPIVRKVAMNAVAHPYGGKRGSRKGVPNIAPKNAPPGRNVGKHHPRRTGRKR